MSELMFILGGFASMWVLAAWIACAAFAGHVAGEKNRCGICWFFWGILFGPISLIAAAGLPVLSSPKQSMKNSTPRKGVFSSAYQPLPVDILKRGE